MSNAKPMSTDRRYDAYNKQQPDAWRYYTRRQALQRNPHGQAAELARSGPARTPRCQWDPGTPSVGQIRSEQRRRAMTFEPDCAFCRILVWAAPAVILREWSDCIAIAPRYPVSPGHTLVIPRVHVEDATVDPVVTATVMARAAEYAQPPCNLITSAGVAATQTVMHLHVHVVPRRVDDGLMLPWSGTTPASGTAAS